MRKVCFLILMLVAGMFAANPSDAKVEEVRVVPNQMNVFVEENVRDRFSYSGLALFYNSVSYYLLSGDELEKVSDEYVEISQGDWLVAVGHYQILAVQLAGQSVRVEDEKLEFKAPSSALNTAIPAKLLLKSDLADFGHGFEDLRYVHLWTPLQLLSQGIEYLLLSLNGALSMGWGLTILIFSVLFKIVMLPSGVMLNKVQRNVSAAQAALAPKLAEIKANYSGEEAHNKYMAAHKEEGVTPFYTLKPLFFTLLPVPFLIAIFNVLGELDLLLGESFLWIADLGRPDAVFHLGFQVPLLGDTVNLLPILMTLFTIMAALLHTNPIVTPDELKKQKKNLYLMAAAFFVLFYPFPAAMVLYWTNANVLQLIQQKFVKI